MGAERPSKKVRPRGEARLILVSLLREGPLTPGEIDERTFAFASNIEGLGDVIAQELHLRSSGERRIRKLDKKYDAKSECERLVSLGLITLNERGKFELTKEGEGTARLTDERMESVLSPKAAARNTTAADFLLAAMKLVVGLLSGSVGLLGDGADATVDTASAAVVWVGVRMKKEALGTFIVAAMMLVTACTIGYDSATKLVGAAQGRLVPISDPYLVIAVEAVGFVSAVFLHLYQRAAGRKNGSLTLISQSVDSRNHVFVSSAVIIGAAFSITGVFFVDALIGAFIAVRFAWDGVRLSREALSSMKGEELDLTKYRLPMERRLQTVRPEIYREWILYSIDEEKLRKRDEIVGSLERTFQPGYFPIMTKSGAKPFDFRLEFPDLVQPLLKKGLLKEEGNDFELTDKGRRWVADSSRTMRYRRSEA